MATRSPSPASTRRSTSSTQAFSSSGTFEPPPRTPSSGGAGPSAGPYPEDADVTFGRQRPTILTEDPTVALVVVVALALVRRVQAGPDHPPVARPGRRVGVGV